MHIFSFNYISIIAQHTAAVTTLDLLLGDEGSLHESKTSQQFTYIMLVAGGI